MLQYALIHNAKTLNDQDIDKAISSLTDKYSKNFVFALLILTKKRITMFKDIIPLLSKDLSHPALSCIDLNTLYSKAKLDKSKKHIKTSKI